MLLCIGKLSMCIRTFNAVLSLLVESFEFEFKHLFRICLNPLIQRLQKRCLTLRTRTRHVSLVLVFFFCHCFCFFIAEFAYFCVFACVIVTDGANKNIFDFEDKDKVPFFLFVQVSLCLCFFYLLICFCVCHSLCAHAFVHH